MPTSPSSSFPRPPVVAVMGHIDHGKSTLLDFIRTSNMASLEAGGITQKISAYEVSHPLPSGETRLITFLDTPGHEAFGKIRMRGASVADVAVLVVSAEDGVKPQTLDALNAIKSAGIPYVVAINKIDKPNADVNRTKQSLAEAQVYVEGYGGDITAVPISAKTGEGVSDLLDMILLTTDVINAFGDRSSRAEGIVIEANTSDRNGVTATLIVKDGTLRVGDFIACGDASAPVRFIENFKGEKIKEATFSSPVRITGWSALPPTGEIFTAYASKKEFEKAKEKQGDSSSTKEHETLTPASAAVSTSTVPLVIKADAQGSLDAIAHEIGKLGNETISFKVVHQGVGEIRESDMKLAHSKEGSVVIAFGVGIDKQADTLRERAGIETRKFSIIYELGDYLKQLLIARTPKVMVEELHGSLKVLKFFSKVKDKQVIGGKVETGLIERDAKVKIMRREHELGFGFIRELQAQKLKVGSVTEGQECGLMVEAKIEIAPGDKLESYVMVEK